MYNLSVIIYIFKPKNLKVILINHRFFFTMSLTNFDIRLRISLNLKFTLT